MKKFFPAIIVMLFVLVCNFASAEDFSVRGGISFTSNKQDIIQFEESEGNEIVSNPTEKEYYSDNCLVCNHIAFAGYNNAKVVYYFDNTDTLSSVMFIVTKTAKENGETEVKDIYKRLNDSLNSKYGNSISLDDAVALKKADGAFGTAEWYNSFSYLGSRIDFEQRVWHIRNGYADIQIMAARHLELDEGLEHIDDEEFDIDQYSVAISYTFIEEDVVQAIIDNANQAEEALNNDL